MQIMCVPCASGFTTRRSCSTIVRTMHEAGTLYEPRHRLKENGIALAPWRWRHHKVTIHSLTIRSQARAVRSSKRSMSRTAGLDFVCSRMSLRRLLARVVRQHFIICPFGGLHSIRANMLPHNALQSPDRMQYPHCRQKILWKRGDSNSRFQSSTLPYSTYSTTKFWTSGGLRVSDFRISPHSQRAGSSSHISPSAPGALVRNNSTRP